MKRKICHHGSRTGGCSVKIGKSIQTIRKSRELSQEQFGRLFHVTRQTASNWENEKSYPDLQALVEISQRFEISLDEMIKDDVRMVQVIDRERRSAKRGRWLICTLAAALVLMGISTAQFLAAFTPASDEERNLSATNAVMYWNFPRHQGRSFGPLDGKNTNIFQTEAGTHPG